MTPNLAVRLSSLSLGEVAVFPRNILDFCQQNAQMHSDFISLVERDALGVEPRQLRRLHADALDAAEAVMEADLLQIRHVIASVPLGLGKLDGDKGVGRPGSTPASSTAASAVPAIVAAQIDAQRAIVAQSVAPVGPVVVATRIPVVTGSGTSAMSPATPPAGQAAHAGPATFAVGMAMDLSAVAPGADASAAMSFADLSAESSSRGGGTR